MKIVKKQNLEFVDGYLINKETGDVLNSRLLVEQYNELLKNQNLNAFLRENKKDIEAARGPLVYTVSNDEKQTITLTAPETPVTDKKTKEALAVWEEMNAVSRHERAVQVLERLNTLIEFVSQDYLLDGGAATMTKFRGNILELTTEDITKIVEEFEELADLREKIIIQ